MAYNLIVSNLANKDLDEILLYIAVKLDNKQAATDFADTVSQKYALIQEQPLMFPLSQNLQLRNRGYRKVVIGNHVFLYRVHKQKQEVFIARFFYGKRDYEKYL